MDFETIKVSIDAQIGRLQLDRPEDMNSFNEKMHQEVQIAIRQLVDLEKVRVIIITGSGRAFCAGQDLKERAGQLDQIALPNEGTLAKYYNPLIETITHAPKPVIAAVNGVAAGAGANIALACDLVITKQSASFIQAFCKIGLIPDAGGTWLLPRLAGHAKAMGLALLGDKISAEQAEKLGLIWQVVPDEQFDSEVQQLAQRLAQQPTYALSLIKQAIHRSTHHTLTEQLELEKNLQYLASNSQDYKEGVKAFTEKRTPLFMGK